MSSHEAVKKQFYVENLFSLRVWYTAMFVGTIAGMVPAVLLSLIWDQLGWSLWFFAPAFILAAVWNMCREYPVRCDDCGKRVKLHYSVCHHCGHNHALVA